MSSGLALEKNLESLITSFITPSYWPSRSGTQNGYDAFARFRVEDAEYVWKFECKDHHADHQLKNFSDVTEIEISDFSEKIMQIMAQEDGGFPHIFCLFIPHKRIGGNNILRDSLRNWNCKNKFPFKILIWDFDFLKDIVPNINHQSAKNIYPNAPSMGNLNHDQAVEKIKSEINKESKDGYLFNRSYIKERKSKGTVLVDGSLNVLINKTQDNTGMTTNLEFAVNDAKFIFGINEVFKNRVKYLPITKTTKSEQLKSISEKQRAQVSNVSPKEFETVDLAKLKEEINDKKSKIIEIFKQEQNGQSLFNRIKDFCSSRDDGVISFVCDEDIEIASLPLKEMDSSDFGSTGDIRFYFEFKESYE